MGCGDRVGCGVTVPVSGDAAADGLRVSDTVPATGQQQSRGLTCHRGGVAAGPSCTGWPGAGWGVRGSLGRLLPAQLTPAVLWGQMGTPGLHCRPWEQLPGGTALSQPAASGASQVTNHR